MKVSFLLLVRALHLNVAVYAAGAEEDVIVRFAKPTREIIKEFACGEYDVASCKPGVYLDIVTTQPTYHELLSSGFDVRIIATPEQSKRNLTMLRTGALAGYRDYEDLVAELHDIASNYPAICRLYNVGDSWGKIYSDAGDPDYDIYHHEVWALKVSDNVDAEEDEPCVFYMGAHHAREPISLEVVMALLYHVVTNYGHDTAITEDVDTKQIWFVPLVNPNGHKIVTDMTATWWRKNICDNNGDGDIDIFEGVDPNRNYGFQWGTFGASDNPNSDIYHGPAPWSEPEVQAMKNLMDTHHFVAGITYHSYSELVLYPYGYDTEMHAPDRDAMAALAIQMAQTIPAEGGGHYTPQESSELYPATGVTDDYAYGERGIFCYTVELGTEFIPPAGEVAGICSDNIEAAMILLNRVDESTLTGHITDAGAGTGIVAEVFVTGVDDTGEFREPYTSDEQFGRYYRFLEGGTCTVTFSAYGFIPSTVDDVVISNGGMTVVDVSLAPAPRVTVTGSVRNGDTMEPISNAELQLLNTTISSVFTGADGGYSFTNIFAGGYACRVSADEYASATTDISVAPSNCVLDFKLYPCFKETFEDAYLPADWTTGGDQDWYITSATAHEGVRCARSGPIADSRDSDLSIVFRVTHAADLSFFRKVSSEADWDYLKFYIDGELQNKWSGQLDWQEETYNVATGVHTFMWRYEKESMVSSGDDCAWIDSVSFPSGIPEPCAAAYAVLLSTAFLSRFRSSIRQGA